MQHKNENLLKDIYEYIDDAILYKNRSPSMSELSEKFSISRATAYNYVQSLKQNGRLSYDGKSMITENSAKLSPTVKVPCFLASIPCGPLEQLDSSIDGYVSLPTMLFGDSDKLFIVRASGDSMVDAGIEEGDLIIMDKSLPVKDGSIVAALDENGNNTLKRLKTKKGKIVLHPENSKYKDIEVKQLSIQGVARFVIKKV